MILKNFQVLAFKNADTIFVSKFNKLYEYKIGDQKPIEIFAFPIDVKTYISKFNVVLRRLFRIDIRYGIKLNSSQIALVYINKIYKLDFIHKRIVSSVDIPRGSRPLNIVQINGLNGFSDGFYFGEYFDNPQKSIVHIFEYINDELKIVYSFDENIINHIHNLIPDKINNCIWVLAGDFDDGAAIFKATDNFKNVERIVYGNQCFRSCVAFPTPKGLLYATDSQFEENSVRLLTNLSGKWESSFLFKINGSCIFGTQINDNFYFSTAVEAINSGNIIKKYLRNTRGPGIIKSQVEIVQCNLQENFKVVYTNKKDCLPFILFQFGNIIFPTGENYWNKLVFTSIATKNNDFSTEILNIE